MSKDLSQEKRGAELNPSENNDRQEKPTEQNSGAQEGSYRNVETSVNKPEDFDDDYEVAQEDDLTMEEPETEDDGRNDKKGKS
jgi:hypothetical protein